MKTLCDYRDEHALGAFLARDKVRAAYEVSDLAPANRPCCRWHIACHDNSQIAAVMLVYSNRVVLTQGEPTAVDALFRCAGPLPAKAHLHLQLEHQAIAKHHYDFQPYRMVRMVVARGDLRQPAMQCHTEAAALDDADRLEADDLTRSVLGNDLPTQSFRDLPAVGAKVGGRLASMAATYAMNGTMGLATIGAVSTLPEHRRQGLAAACTSTLCSLLLGEVNLVALSVREENQPARALYRKLGFVEHNVYFEAQATKH